MLNQEFEEISDWAWEDINTFNSDIDCFNEEFTPVVCDNLISHDYYSKSCTSSFIHKAEEESWTEQDDDMLYKLASRFNNQWEKVAIFFEGKSCESLKKRWNHIKRTHRAKDIWTAEEDEQLLKLREIYRTDYRTISRHFKQKSIIKVKRRCRILSKQLESKLLANYSNLLQSDDKNPDEIIDSFFSEDSLSTGASDDYENSKASPDTEEESLDSRNTRITRSKSSMLQTLYDKMNNLEKLFKDTSSQILKLAESYESKEK